MAGEAHAISCRTTRGVTYIPIPPGTANYAGLFTVDLPDSVRVGNEFNIRVRRIASRRTDTRVVGLEAAQSNAAESQISGSHTKILVRNWRYVTGTFQVKIPVGADAPLLHPEQDTLAILKWRLAHFAHEYRWRPVLERYIAYVSRRVDGFGGDAGAVKPSLTGYGPLGQHTAPRSELRGHTGKVSGLVYDAFGDFEGFWLQSEDGAEHRFCSRERQIEDLVRHAWVQRILISVQNGHHEPERPLRVTYRRAPRPSV